MNYYNQDRYQGSYRSNSGNRYSRTWTDRIIEEGHSLIKIIGVILEEEILEKYRIIEVKILEEDIEVASETIILEEAEVDLEKTVFR